MSGISRRDLLIGGGAVFADAISPLRAAEKSSGVPHRSQTSEPANEWVQSARILIAEGYNPPFYPHLDFDPAKSVRIAADLHADAFRYPAASYYAYFPTRSKYPVHRQLSEDLMRETLRLCRAAGLNTIAYLPVNHPFMDIHDRNPHYAEWQRRDVRGKPFYHEAFRFCPVLRRLFELSPSGGNCQTRPRSSRLRFRSDLF